MIGINYTAFAIRNGKEICTGVLADGCEIVQISMGGSTEVVRFEYIAQICERRGWELYVDTGTHLFDHTFADNEVGLEEKAHDV